MSVLSRKVGQSLLIGDMTDVRVLEIRGGRMLLRVTAPLNVAIKRMELFDFPGPENEKRIGQRAELLETK